MYGCILWKATFEPWQRYIHQLHFMSDGAVRYKNCKCMFGHCVDGFIGVSRRPYIGIGFKLSVKVWLQSKMSISLHLWKSSNPSLSEMSYLKREFLCYEIYDISSIKNKTIALRFFFRLSNMFIITSSNHGVTL